MITSLERNFFNNIRSALDDFSMIDKKDRILIGISGGKDSMALLFALNTLKKFRDFNFSLSALCLDYDWGMDFSPIIKYCNKENIELFIKKTDIKNSINFNDKNPCYLCTRMRKGIIGNFAKEHGYKKIAYGHHLDDAVETVFMNLLYTGQFGCFLPNSKSEQKDLSIIRPMIYVTEKTIQKVISEENLPVVESLCLVDKKSKRQEMKTLIATLEKNYPDIRQKIIASLKHIDTNKLWI